MGADELKTSAESTVEDLEREGDIAADFLEGLLDIADIDGDLNLDVRQGRAYVSVEAEDDGLSLLSEPETVQALQELRDGHVELARTVVETVVALRR